MEKSTEQMLDAFADIKGAEFEDYCLINNYGLKIAVGNYRIDLRRWANCYGFDAGWGWSASKRGAEPDKWEHIIGTKNDYGDGPTFEACVEQIHKFIQDNA